MLAYSFVVAGRCYETSRTETIKFIIYSTANKLSNLTRIMGGDPVGCYACSKFALYSLNSRLGESLLQ